MGMGESLETNKICNGSPMDTNILCQILETLEYLFSCLFEPRSFLFVVSGLIANTCMMLVVLYFQDFELPFQGPHHMDNPSPFEA